MKSLQHFIFLIVLCISSYSSHAQVLTFKNAEVNKGNFEEFAALTDDKLISPTTLHALFSKKVNKYLSEGTDLSFSKAYAQLDNADGRLFLGGTFDTRKKSQAKLETLITLGIKANIKDGFAGLVGKKGLNNDLGVSAKITFFGNGTIHFYKDNNKQKKDVTEKRKVLENELLYKMDKEITEAKEKYIGLSDKDSLVKAVVEKQAEKVKEDFAEQEATFIDENKLYNVAHTWWLTFDAYIPVTETEYEVALRLNYPNTMVDYTCRLNLMLFTHIYGRRTE